MKKYVSLLLFLFCLPLFAQDEKEHELSTQVQELYDFHDVIYQIWHTGWPEKNISLLKSLLPQVEEGYNKIKAVELPGILRDKQAKWDEGLIELEKSIESYKTTTAQNDSVGILNAAEKLHSDFEMMVRVIRPVLKEVDAFHQVLYMLYHYYLPDYDFEKIKQAALDMKEKMDDLNKAALTKRVEARKDQFEKARNELNDSVIELSTIVTAGDDKDKVSAAVENLHTKYVELEHIFD